MRTLKFRVWRTAAKAWAEDTYFEYGPFDKFLELTEENNETFQQFTGFKDKNGKEIYEGDIVEFQAITFETGYVVQEKSGAWIFKPLDKKSILKDYFISAWRKRLKVIGNIHENSELIK